MAKKKKKKAIKKKIGKRKFPGLVPNAEDAATRKEIRAAAIAQAKGSPRNAPRSSSKNVKGVPLRESVATPAPSSPRPPRSTKAKGTDIIDVKTGKVRHLPAAKQSKKTAAFTKKKAGRKKKVRIKKGKVKVRKVVESPAIKARVVVQHDMNMVEASLENASSVIPMKGKTRGINIKGLGSFITSDNRKVRIGDLKESILRTVRRQVKSLPRQATKEVTAQSIKDFLTGKEPFMIKGEAAGRVKEVVGNIDVVDKFATVDEIDVVLEDMVANGELVSNKRPTFRRTTAKNRAKKTVVDKIETKFGITKKGRDILTEGRGVVKTMPDSKWFGIEPPKSRRAVEGDLDLTTFFAEDGKQGVKFTDPDTGKKFSFTSEELAKEQVKKEKVLTPQQESKQRELAQKDAAKKVEAQKAKAKLRVRRARGTGKTAIVVEELQDGKEVQEVVNAVRREKQFLFKRVLARRVGKKQFVSDERVNRLARLLGLSKSEVDESVRHLVTSTAEVGERVTPFSTHKIVEQLKPSILARTHGGFIKGSVASAKGTIEAPGSVPPLSRVGGRRFTLRALDQDPRQMFRFMSKVIARNAGQRGTVDKIVKEGLRNGFPMQQTHRMVDEMINREMIVLTNRKNGAIRFPAKPTVQGGLTKAANLAGLPEDQRVLVGLRSGERLRKVGIDNIVKDALGLVEIQKDGTIKKLPGKGLIQLKSREKILGIVERVTDFNTRRGVATSANEIFSEFQQMGIQVSHTDFNAAMDLGFKGEKAGVSTFKRVGRASAKKGRVFVSRGIERGNRVAEQFRVASQVTGVAKKINDQNVLRSIIMKGLKRGGSNLTQKEFIIELQRQAGKRNQIIKARDAGAAFKSLIVDGSIEVTEGTHTSRKFRVLTDSKVQELDSFGNIKKPGTSGFALENRTRSAVKDTSGAKFEGAKGFFASDEAAATAKAAAQPSVVKPVASPTPAAAAETAATAETATKAAPVAPVGAVSTGKKSPWQRLINPEGKNPVVIDAQQKKRLLQVARNRAKAEGISLSAAKNRVAVEILGGKEASRARGVAGRIAKAEKAFPTPEVTGKVKPLGPLGRSSGLVTEQQAWRTFIKRLPGPKSRALAANLRRGGVPQRRIMNAVARGGRNAFSSLQKLEAASGTAVKAAGKAGAQKALTGKVAPKLTTLGRIGKFANAAGNILLAFEALKATRENTVGVANRRREQFGVTSELLDQQIQANLALKQEQSLSSLLSSFEIQKRAQDRNEQIRATFPDDNQNQLVGLNQTKLSMLAQRHVPSPLELLAR